MILETASLSNQLHGLYLMGPKSPAGWLDRAFEPVDDYRFEFCETPSVCVALDLLHEQPFDFVVMDLEASENRPAAELITAFRAQTNEYQPMIVMASSNDRQNAANCLQAGAAAFVTILNTTAAELAWHFSNAVQQAEAERELERLRASVSRDSEQQREAILKQLDEQVTMFVTAANLRAHRSNGAAPRVADGSGSTDATPAGSPTTAGDQAVVDECCDLLKAFVVMGRGQLVSEIERLLSRLVEGRTCVADFVRCFSLATQKIVCERGARSARHVFDRANFLLLDLLFRWTDMQTIREHHDAVDRHPHIQ